jgi:hypothetical protein
VGRVYPDRWDGRAFDALESAMIAETIREKLDQNPFEPFLIVASSGRAYKVSSPDLVVVMKTKVFIAEPNSDRAVTIPLFQIAAVEESPNGHPRRGRRGKKS